MFSWKVLCSTAKMRSYFDIKTKLDELGITYRLEFVSRNNHKDAITHILVKKKDYDKIRSVIDIKRFIKS